MHLRTSGSLHSILGSVQDWPDRLSKASAYGESLCQRKDAASELRRIELKIDLKERVFFSFLFFFLSLWSPYFDEYQPHDGGTQLVDIAPG